MDTPKKHIPLAIKTVSDTFNRQARFLTLTQLASLAANGLDYHFDPGSVSVIAFSGEDWATRHLSMSRSYTGGGVSIVCRFSFRLKCNDRTRLLRMIKDVLAPWPVNETINLLDYKAVHFDGCISAFAKNAELVTLEPVVRSVLTQYVLLSKVITENQWNKRKSTDAPSSTLEASTAGFLF